MDKKIKKAITVLNRGGIIIFPTDTAFGVGCRLDNSKAIERLFKIRRRASTQAVPVLVASGEMAKKYYSVVTPLMQHYMDDFWPGALTIVGLCNPDKIYHLVRGGGNKIGLRQPDHTDILEIINQIKVPLLGPSANFHGDVTPYEYHNLNKDFTDLVDYVLEGECKIQLASTVVDCTVKKPVIIRQGAVSLNI